MLAINDFLIWLNSFLGGAFWFPYYLLGIGLFFTVWTIQTFGETRQVITNIALIGVSSIILSTILMMTAVILYSVVNVVREKRT